MGIKILLDTDIGTDIDDALCLAYLLCQPKCELLGITTVSGDVVARAKLASVLCRRAGKDVPIYPGVRLPMVNPERQPHVPQAEALKKWPHDKRFPEGEAIEFMRRTIRQNPGEVILLTIGPMTNAGLLFSVDPEIPSLLKGLFMMAGVFEYNAGLWGPCLAEWNVICDPHAAGVVYHARPAIHRSVGLDVTTRCALSFAEVKRRFTAPILKPVIDMAKVWFKKASDIIFHDPLAGASIFDPGILRWKRGLIEPDLTTQKTPGILTFRKDEQGPHEYACDVNPKRLFNHYFGVLDKLRLD
jgi:purine nucleosidase